MRTTHSKVQPRAFHRWLVHAGVLLLGLAWCDASLASSVASSWNFDTAEHAQHCGCGPKCRQTSCCCGPRTKKASPPVPKTGQLPLQVNASLCMSSAPCGDPGLPSSSTISSIGKTATLTLAGHILPLASERHIPSFSRCIFPARRASRLDEPPEGTAIA